MSQSLQQYEKSCPSCGKVASQEQAHCDGCGRVYLTPYVSRIPLPPREEQAIVTPLPPGRMPTPNAPSASYRQPHTPASSFGPVPAHPSEQRQQPPVVPPLRQPPAPYPQQPQYSQPVQQMPPQTTYPTQSASVHPQQSYQSSQDYQGYQQPMYQYQPPMPGMIQQPPGTHSTTAAGLLGFFLAGAGQMVNRQYLKGIVLFFCAFFAAFVTFGIGGFVIWLLAFIDSIQIANRINRGEAVGPWQFF